MDCFPARGSGTISDCACGFVDKHYLNARLDYSMRAGYAEAAMGMPIAHFMWGYQPHFRIHKECDAERLFQSIDKRLEPEVFIVGVLSDGTLDRFPACVEPEDNFWIRSEDFNDVLAVSGRILKNYPEAGMFQSHPLAQKWQDEDLFKRSIQDAVRKIIELHPSKPPDTVFRVSYPAKVDRYWTCVVLGLQNSVLSAYTSLKTSYVKMHELRHIPVPTSFIEAAVDAFLRQATDELLRPNPGLGRNDRDFEELLRAAGDGFMTGLVWRIDQNCIEGMYGLFRSLTTVSSLPYEKTAGFGRILLARRNHPCVAKKISFASPTPLTAYRSMRKLLELASDDLPLFCDPEHAFGLAEKREYLGQDEDLFEVQILGHHRWEVRHAGQVLMRVQYGLPSLPKLPFDENKFRTDLPRIFRDLTPPDIDRLVDLVRIAERESHGTMLVITEAAATETQRLAQQGTPISPCPLTAETLKRLTSIDGAIIMTPTGVCHAIGTIVDGKASQNGDPGRGARFNSAIRYHESVEAPCLVVVVSSDGGVDFIPNPLPAIRRSLIDQAIEEIQGLKSAAKINIRHYRATLDWLDEHSFYLKERDCNTLNPLVEELEERIKRETQSSLLIVRSPFTPHPAMNDDQYYLEE